MSSSRSRNGMIDIMKFLFTILILFFHTFKLFPGGYIAVDFFFLVSGYLMAKSMEKRLSNGIPIGTDALSFVLHKAWGIFPYYIVAWCLTFAIAQVIKGASLSESLILLFRSPFNIFMLEMAGNYDMGHRIQGSWYISAMLLAILALYPLRKKHTDAFDHVIAPLFALLFLGYVYQVGGGISLTVDYIPQLFCYDGLLRGAAELSLGCFCYRMAEKIKARSFSTAGKLLLSALEMGGYGIVFYSAYKIGRTDRDLVLVLLLALSVTLSFSGRGAHIPCCNNRIFSYLGSFSLQLYLTHEFVKNTLFPWLRKNTFLADYLISPTLSFFLAYFAVTILAALLVRFLGNLISKHGPVALVAARKRLLNEQP